MATARQVMMTEHGTQCFRIIRTDGSGTDFSYPHRMSQRPPSRKQEVAQALRRTVRFDLYKARDNFFATHSGSDGSFPVPLRANVSHGTKRRWITVLQIATLGKGLR